MTEQPVEPAPLGGAGSRDPRDSAPPEAPDAPPAAAGPDPLSAMTPRFNLFFRLFANRFFRHFDLDDDTITTIIKLAQDERDAATCLHEFTRSLNDVLDADGRTRVVELLWQVAYADGRLDVYEEHLVRKVADLLHVPHSAYIHAKLRAAPSA